MQYLIFPLVPCSVTASSPLRCLLVGPRVLFTFIENYTEYLERASIHAVMSRQTEHYWYTPRFSLPTSLKNRAQLPVYFLTLEHVVRSECALDPAVVRMAGMHVLNLVRQLARSEPMEVNGRTDSIRDGVCEIVDELGQRLATDDDAFEQVRDMRSPSILLACA